MITRINKYLGTRKPRQVFLACLVMMSLLGLVDYITGYEVSFSIFYLIPIALVGWYSTKIYAVSISLISAVIWMYADLLAGQVYSQSWIPVWNAVVRLGFFGITVALLSGLKDHLVNEEMLSRTDSLTGVNNQRAFKEWLSHHIQVCGRYSYPMALGYIDLDNFKYVNDTFGHTTGDQVLLKVGSILSSSVRKSDIVGRLGGDEFAVLLPNADLTGATSLFEKLHQNLLDEMRLNSWPVGFSVGVAVFTTVPNSDDEAIMIADKLMYTIKHGSKNSIMYQVLPENTQQCHVAGDTGVRG